MNYRSRTRHSGCSKYTLFTYQIHVLVNILSTTATLLIMLRDLVERSIHKCNALFIASKYVDVVQN